MIKYLDLKKINQSFEPLLTESLIRVSNSGWYLQGEATTSFEREFADYCGTRHCIGAANGLDALTLIFLAYRELGLIEVNDEVIVPANTFIATILSVLRAGLKPVLCEPSPLTCNIDVAKAETLITSRTRAIVPVHLYGSLADMQAINILSKKYGLIVVEDAAQAHGAICNGGLEQMKCSINNLSADTNLEPFCDESKPLRAGSMGHAAAFSFYPAKNLGALGDGGAVTTSDTELANAIRAIANYGSSEKYVHRYRGINSRLDELQAAALSVKLPRLDADNHRRREIAQIYKENIRWEQIGATSTCLYQEINKSDVFHVFPLFTPQRNRLQQHLAEHDIQSQIHYPIPPHRQEALLSEYGMLQLPITEQMHHQELSIPISPMLTCEEVEKIVQSINSFTAK